MSTCTDSCSGFDVSKAYILQPLVLNLLPVGTNAKLRNTKRDPKKETIHEFSVNLAPEENLRLVANNSNKTFCLNW